jgi:hypothetical protein
MGVAREMGRLIRLSYNGHLAVGELTGYIFPLDKTRSCLEAAIAIEANAVANAPPPIPAKIDVSIITVLAGHFVSEKQFQQIANGEFLKQVEHERVPLSDYARNAAAQAEADRELNAAIEAAAIIKPDEPAATPTPEVIAPPPPPLDQDEIDRANGFELSRARQREWYDEHHGGCQIIRPRKTQCLWG